MNTLIAGTGGLGTNIAFRLLKRGDSVVITTRSAVKGIRIEKELSAFGNVSHIVADPRTDPGVKDLFERVKAKFGRFDNLVVTLGGYASDSIENPVHLNEMLESNLVIPLNILKHFPKFANSKGSAVLISSIQSIYTSSWASTSYILGKNSLNKLVELAAAQLLNKEIRVNAVAPSSIENVFAPGREWRSTRKIGSRQTPPEDIAEVVKFLCSPESEWIDGVVIPLDGGNRFTHSSD